MPQVYSRRKGADPIPEGAVYVGRPTAFGNPFKVDEVGQEAAVAQYREWVYSNLGAELRKRARRVLAGKDLVCWCQSPSDVNPKPCHATVLLEIANRKDD